MSRYLIFFNFLRQYSSKKGDMGQAPKWEGCLTWPQVASGERSPQYFLEISGSPPLVSPGVVEVVRSPAELFFWLSLAWSTLPFPVP